MSEAMSRAANGALSADPTEARRYQPREGQTEFTIGELSREFGVTLRSLRFYEDKGLLNPRRVGTSRIFSRRDRARVHLILLGKRIGLTLSEIKELLDVYDAENGPVLQLRLARQRFDEQIVNLETQVADLQSGLRELRELRDDVDRELVAAETGRRDN